MGDIRRLPPELANLIKAGEVVAGPASVVKELVENSLDAGAREIEVRLAGGGIHEIVVADNGRGMDREDAVLCLESGATSKIRTADDLHRIGTRGFRGEALGAIGAAADVRIDTRRAAEPAGTRVIKRAGRAGVEALDAARQPGTTVTVEHLFHTVPARRAQLAKPGTETRRVRQMLAALSLAHLGVSFRLTADGEDVLDLPPTEEIRDRLAALYGDEWAMALSDATSARGEAGSDLRVEVNLLVTPPALAVRAAQRSATLINGRPVFQPEVERLIRQVFGEVLPSPLRPEAILTIELSPAHVDPNVTPDKARVRINDRAASRAWATVTEAFRAILARPEWVARLSTEPEPFVASDEPAPAAATLGLSFDEALVSSHMATATAYTEPSIPNNRVTPSALAEYALGAVLPVAGRYLIVPGPRDLLLVDQHSAHERLLYEQMRRRLATEGVAAAAAGLLFPESVTLTPEERLTLADARETLHTFGFDIEISQTGAQLNAVPDTLVDRDCPAALRQLLSDWAIAEDAPGDRGAEALPRERRERLLRSLACRSAVKAGQALSPEAARSLWQRVAHLDLGAHDVHGRPAILRLSYDEIDRRLGRMG